MVIDQARLAFHEGECAIAARLYIDSKRAEPQAEIWTIACRSARTSVAELLEHSDDLLNIEAALEANAGHLFVLRRMLAPPQSQDQFKLICGAYSKQSENAARPLSAGQAGLIAAAIVQWHDTGVAPWVGDRRKPTVAERDRFLDIVSTLISVQVALTDSRKMLSNVQEQAIVELLQRDGWLKRPPQLVSTLADLQAKEFMHKAPFATRSQPQEVDIACGLGKTVVLAMECKVSNDATNSIKRINDVLKKAEAWKSKWGDFVRTAVLLQGVIAPKEMKRLMLAEVEIFWSHRIDDFAAWLATHVRL